MSGPNKIVYWAEQLPGKRGQLHRDVVVHGELRSELSGPIGSPAPIDTVRTFERTIKLDSDTLIDDVGDLADQMLLAGLVEDADDDFVERHREH